MSSFMRFTPPLAADDGGVSLAAVQWVESLDARESRRQADLSKARLKVWEGVEDAVATEPVPPHA